MTTWIRMMTRKIDLQGTRVGRLVVGLQASDGKWECRCDCGSRCKKSRASLRKGKVKSCGCFRKERASQGLPGTRHGKTKSKEYRTWASMKTRCLNPRYSRYPDYGGRGIHICDRWLRSFESFMADVGPAPGLEYSLDRYPNNNGNYEPGNVRWATRSQQQRNKRK